MFLAIAGILEAGLSLWASKEKHKYVDQLIELKRKYHEEMAKPDPDRNDAQLDYLEHEMLLLGIAFAAEAQGTHVTNQP